MKKGVILLLLFSLLVLASCENINLDDLSDEDLARISEKAVICNKPYIRVGIECCLDQDDNKICDRDEPSCDAGKSLIDGKCCIDQNQNEVCDYDESVEVKEKVDEPAVVKKIVDEPEKKIVLEPIVVEEAEPVKKIVVEPVVVEEADEPEKKTIEPVDETSDYLFYDDFSNGYLESNWQALYGTYEIDNSKGDPAPSLKLTDRARITGDTSPFNSKNGLEMSVMVNVDDFDDKGFLINIVDQVRGRAAASLQFNKGQQEGEIMFWYRMYPIDSVPTVLGTDVKTNDHKFHEYKFVIEPDGKAAWYRDGVQKKRLAGAARIPQGDMYFYFQSYNDPVYIDNVIIN
ncbi:hypothetical protein ACFL0W_06765 [Nanoarchaeota archaeon]